MDFTIAIPTYNGAKRLPAVFEALEQQKDISDIVWEVLVVDNNSTDDTAEVVKKHQKNWLSNVPLRYYFEPQQGAAFARQKAVQEAKGSWIGFLDDDNCPKEDWLKSAAQFRNHSEKLGAFNGKILGVYEVDPPEDFEKIKVFLAIRDHGTQTRKFIPENLDLPPGAGLFVKRSAWLSSVPQQQKLTGKLPGLFIQGDDYEPLLYLYKNNWEIWYAPNLCIFHHLSAQRFDRSYLLTLAKGCGLPTFQLRLILSKSYLDTWILFWRTLLGNGRRIILHGLQYRNRIFKELVPGFWWEFYWGSFLSPFVRSAKNFD